MKSPDKARAQKRIRVFCCFRYELWNHLMVLALARNPELEVTGSARADEQADWTRLTAMHPDVLLTAIDGAPRDWAFLARLRPLLRWTRLLVMGEPNRWLAARVLRFGASGYLYPETSLALLFKAIETVYRGELWADRRLAALAVGPAESPQAVERLTHQESNILRAMAAGRRNKEIAAEFGISEATVKSHLNRAYRKLNLSDRLQAALFVERYGLEGWIQRPHRVAATAPDPDSEWRTSADETAATSIPVPETTDEIHPERTPGSAAAGTVPLLADTGSKS